MLHVHFGAGRLGLGLVAPFFRKPGSELYLLDRAVSGSKDTGCTALDPGRRNELLRDHPEKQYFIRRPGSSPGDHQAVRYDGFLAYGGDDVREIVRSIARGSAGKRAGVVVTASVLKPENYAAVIDAVDALCAIKDEDPDSIGPIFLVACEDTLHAHEVLEDSRLSSKFVPGLSEHVTPVRALVDRLCVELEEDRSGAHPTVLARAEDYGSLKLGLTPETEPLVALCEGSRVEFGRHIDVEKQINGWLVNGTHSLIALTAFKEAEGNPELRLDEYINSSPEHAEFASSAIKEIGEGIAILLHTDPRYEAFARDVDVDRYIEGACRKFFERIAATEAPINRILARFRAPSPGAAGTIESFARRFADRVDGPIDAYEREHGHLPPAATKSILNMSRLVASGTFIDTAHAQPA